MKLSAIKIDPVRIEQGDWIRDIPEMEDLELKVRGIGTADYRKLQARLLKGVSRGERQRGSLEPETQDRITAQLLAETVIVDWRNLLDEKGKALPFSKEKALELLSDPSLSAFRDAVAWAAAVVAQEDAADAEDYVKN